MHINFTKTTNGLLQKESVYYRHLSYLPVFFFLISWESQSSIFETLKLYIMKNWLGIFKMNVIDGGFYSLCTAQNETKTTFLTHSIQRYFLRWLSAIVALYHSLLSAISTLYTNKAFLYIFIELWALWKMNENDDLLTAGG